MKRPTRPQTRQRGGKVGFGSGADGAGVRRAGAVTIVFSPHTDSAGQMTGREP